jgi:hypothetical protein
LQLLQEGGAFRGHPNAPVLEALKHPRDFPRPVARHPAPFAPPADLGVTSAKLAIWAAV